MRRLAESIAVWPADQQLPGSSSAQPDFVQRRPARVVDRRPVPAPAGPVGPLQPRAPVQDELRNSVDLAADALQLVTKVVEFRIAQARLLQIALQARKLLLPTRDPLLDVDADALVGTRNDVGSIDLRGRGLAGCAVA